MAVGSSEDVVLDRAQVWPLVCALPVRLRAVIVLRYYVDLSEREIADVLGCSTGNGSTKVEFRSAATSTIVCINRS